jgi:hypothetical protein
MLKSKKWFSQMDDKAKMAFLLRAGRWHASEQDLLPLTSFISLITLWKEKPILFLSALQTNFWEQA